ncbi:hypothetical protein [Azotobacter vinelandii]|uniref:hypothetical protein n=1 Tax=Azotobacter vinelandii TaxID=354 RepID=UPI0020C8E2B1|nr:hypothetical protein [Azotobacter vinelandii]
MVNSLRYMCLWPVVGLLSSAVGSVALASSGGNGAYPEIPEPMVFDMMRPLGARQGELEANVLATGPLSESDQQTDWAPEAEYAFADGWAVEFEFPFEDDRLSEYKVGVQATLGAFNQGRSAHGVQYMNIYEREHHKYFNTLVYTLGHRFSARWSSMSMIGLADIGWSGSSGRNHLIVNHSTFFDATENTVLGVELNYRSGHDGHVLLMPQIHHRLTRTLNLQFGIGVDKARGESALPEAGLRIVRQF